MPRGWAKAIAAAPRAGPSGAAPYGRSSPKAWPPPALAHAPPQPSVHPAAWSMMFHASARGWILQPLSAMDSARETSLYPPGHEGPLLAGLSIFLVRASCSDRARPVTTASATAGAAEVEVVARRTAARGGPARSPPATSS